MPRLSFRPFLLPGVLMLAAVTCLGACKEKRKPDEGQGPPGAETVRKEVLSAGSACVLMSAKDFQALAVTLETATAAQAASPGASTRDAAREAFQRAADGWQVLESMQVGPAAARSMPGGAELRDNIYSWPLISRCAVEEQLVSRGYQDSGFATTLVTRRGLAALEYLLFYEGADTACAPSSPIVTQGTWAALSADERAARKRAYAAAAAVEVRHRADQLVDAWEPGKGNFTETLVTAGPGNAVYATGQAGLNSLSDALFYVEHDVKDLKIARPLGLRDCESDTCPELLESRFAARNKRNIRSNLVGFRRLLEGCGTNFEGTGFDDLLSAVGAEAQAAKLREGTAAAQASLEAIDEPDLDQALAQDKASVRAFYDTLKVTTDLLKTEVVTVLDLELPKTVEGDND